MSEQRTLTGDSADRVQCEYYDGCKADALFIGELLVYTDSGDDQQMIRACRSCADEHVEPETAVESDTWTRMKPEDRYVGGDPTEDAATVYAVLSTYVDDPHPHVEGVFAGRDPAEELMEDCRDKFSAPHPTAWSLWKLTAGEQPEMIDP